MMRRLYPLFVLLLALTAGCSSGDGLAESLTGHEYWSTSVTEDGAPRVLAANTRITLRISDEGVSVNAGCNTMGGSFDVDDGRLVTGGLSMTEMGCDPERHAQDDFVATVLGARPTVTVDGDTLSLRTDSVAIDFIDAAIANPARPLVGTRWEIDGFLSGATASSFATTTPGRILFDDDRTMQLFDGCTTVVIPVEIDGNLVRFEPLGMAEITDCDAPPGYRQSIYTALSRGSLEYSISGDRMAMNTPDIVGFTLRATE